jgi:hypothetical protein
MDQSLVKNKPNTAILEILQPGLLSAALIVISQSDVVGSEKLRSENGELKFPQL